MGRRAVTAAPMRGQIYRVRIAGDLKSVVIVSNNARNRRLGSVLAVRVTTAPKPSLASIVEIPKGEAVVGRAMCDEVAPVRKELLGAHVGALSREAMRAVDAGLKVALALE